MHVSLLSGLLAGALLASGCEATWKFHVKDSYLSDLHLQEAGSIIPMVYNKVTEQVMRLLPAKQIVHDIHCPCAEHPDPTTNYNIFQAFSADFTHKKHKYIGPPGCPLNALNVFYEYSSDADSSSSSSSSGSDDNAASYVVSACPNQVSAYNYPCLTQRCNIQSTVSPILRAITSEAGQTYVLTNTTLSIMDGNCHTLVEDNLCRHFSRPWNCTAVDMILDETTQTALVGFIDGRIVQFSMPDLELLANYFLFDVPSATPYILHASAMRAPGSLFFRAYIGDEVYIFRFDGTDLSKEVEPRKIGEGVCVTSCDGLPLIINDFKHGMDIIVSREEHRHRLFFLTTKVVASTYLRQCSSAKMPECFKDAIQPFTGAKIPDCNGFFVGFTPSLNLLHIAYEDVVVKQDAAIDSAPSH